MYKRQVLGFILGFIITISEPDLQVLANQVPSISNSLLIVAVALGVGIFLSIALLRILFSIALPPMLVFFYSIVFILAFFVPKDFLAVEMCIRDSKLKDVIEKPWCSIG